MSYLNKTYCLDRSNKFGIFEDDDDSETIQENSMTSFGKKDNVFKPNFNNLTEFLNCLPKEISLMVWGYISQNIKDDMIFSRNIRIIKNLKVFVSPVNFCQYHPKCHVYEEFLRKIPLPNLLQYIKNSKISKFYKVFKKKILNNKIDDQYYYLKKIFKNSQSRDYMKKRAIIDILAIFLYELSPHNVRYRTIKRIVVVDNYLKFSISKIHIKRTAEMGNAFNIIISSLLYFNKIKII